MAAGCLYWFMQRRAVVTDAAIPASRNPASTLAVAPSPAASQEHAASPVPRSAARGANPIEGARRATVLIKTGWGLGAGFIVDDACHVVTNRHVVETGGSRVAERVVTDQETQSRMAVAQQPLRVEIEREQRCSRRWKTLPE